MEETQITKIKNGEDITSDFIEIQRNIGECYEQMDTRKLDNIDEISKSPKKTQTIEN